MREKLERERERERERESELRIFQTLRLGGRKKIERERQSCCSCALRKTELLQQREKDSAPVAAQLSIFPIPLIKKGFEIR